MPVLTFPKVVCIVFFCVCLLLPGPCYCDHVEVSGSSAHQLDARSIRKELYRLRRDLLEALVARIEVDLEEFPENKGVEVDGVDIKDGEAGRSQTDVVESDSVDSMAIAALPQGRGGANNHRRPPPRSKPKTGSEPSKPSKTAATPESKSGKTAGTPGSKTSIKKERLREAKRRAAEKEEQKEK